MHTPLSVWLRRPAGRATHSGDHGRPEWRWKSRALAGATALLCALAAPPAVRAQAPYLVKDINPAFAVPTDSNPQDLVAVGSVLFFSACSRVDESGNPTDCELWKSDGTETGTVRVKDINPGTGSSYPYDLTNVNGMLFFFACADYPYAYGELWKSDGTEAGTVRVAGAYAIPGSSISVNGTLFFTRLYGSPYHYGVELWKSDGTEAGTVRVKVLARSLCTDETCYSPPVADVNGTLFFTAEDGTSGIELWKSDGTEAGTVRVKDINPGAGSSHPQSLTNVNGTLFFSATDGTSGYELWKSDGTEAGTVPVKDINPGTGSSSPRFLTDVNGTAFFSADDGTSGEELWTSDGTEAGTVRVKDIYPGAGSSFYGYPDRPLRNVNGVLFFVADDGTSGQELWKSDGTETGTLRVKDIYPGSGGSGPYGPQYLTDVNGTLFFSADDGTNGVELWKSAGTEAGTVRVKDANPGAGGSNPYYLTSVNGTLFFGATDGISGFELWKSDGTEAGTVRVKDIVPPGPSSSWPFSLTNVNGTLFFRADDGASGSELWKSDGTEAGTVLVKDINPGTGNASPWYLTDVNGTLFFSADDGTSGRELWKSDGTEAGTARVKDINLGAGSSLSWTGHPGHLYQTLTNVNGTLFFRADDGTSGIELWKTDGTEAGTVRVRDIVPGAGSSWAEYLTNANGTLFFNADDGTSGRELWKSDGTEAGTVRVKDIYPGYRSSDPRYLTNVNGTLFFGADDGASGWELWKSDGTEAGTVRVRDIYPGADSSWAGNLTDVNGTLFFSAKDGTSGIELWRSDGTGAGTVRVKDILPGQWDSRPEHLTNVDGALFFSACSQLVPGPQGMSYSADCELWKSDGTEAGTLRVKDINPVSRESSDPHYLTNVNGTLFFSAYDGTSGYELWKSDGSETGTVRVADSGPARWSSSPMYLTQVGSRLFFSANDGAVGRELWAYDLLADLGITKSDGLAVAPAGGSVTYTITVTNAGPLTATGATVVDTFPAVLACKTICAGTGGATCTAGPFAGNINDTVNLPPAGTATYTSTCAVSPSASGTLSNTATVTVPSTVRDPNVANNTATDVDLVVPPADLSVTLADSPDPVTGLGTVTYTIGVSNQGPGAASSLVAVQSLTAVPSTPPMFQSASGRGWGCVAGITQVTCVRASLGLGAAPSLTIQWQVGPAGGALDAQAVVSATEADPNFVDNSATASTTVTGVAYTDLWIRQTDDGVTVLWNGPITYTITVSNAGPDAVVGATVSDGFPASVVGVVWTCAASKGSSCAPSGRGNISDTSVNLLLEGTATYTATGRVLWGTVGPITNTAIVSSPIFDTNSGNNTMTLNTPVDTDLVFKNGFE